MREPKREDPEVIAAMNRMFAHPAFPAFKAHIANFAFRGDGLITAWCWFRDGWDSSRMKPPLSPLFEEMRKNLDQMQHQAEQLKLQHEALCTENKRLHDEIESELRRRAEKEPSP